MTNDELAAITAREQRATIGPWTVKRVQNLYPSEAGDGRTYPAIRGFRCPKAIYERAWEQVEQDAAFMAAARTDVPALVNEVRRLRRRLREMHLVVAEAAEFDPRATPKDILRLVEDLLKEEEEHWRGGPVPPPREAEYLR
ncbi:MAG TPA: hypothetical protein VIL35_12205 [Vicinamibacterales bacterium]